jgi:hypothetical protein
MASEQQRASTSPTHYSQWFVLVTAVFVTCLITANITAVKLVGAFGLVLPAGVIVFPISYIFGDVLTEVYGYRQSRRVIWLGFFCNLIAVGSAIVTQWLAKTVYEAAVTPLTYRVVNFLKRQEGLDVYDHDTRFNPLLIEF